LRRGQIYERYGGWNRFLVCSENADG
jgi:hypothetical protein